MTGQLTVNLRAADGATFQLLAPAPVVTQPGTFTADYTDNGNGTWTSTTATDNGNGTWTD